MTASSAGPVRPGDILAAKYRVERVLGAGGMGVVVLATHMQLDQAVALKFLLPEAAANLQIRSRFEREARLAVKLRSENVAKVLDVGTLADGAPYIVMEYLSGEDLGQRLQRDGPVSLSDAAEFVIQACDGIAEAHALGIVHRDLKPTNLFLTQRADGTPLVKVLDFGISKASQLDEGGHGLTKTNAVMGSPHYMSPEQMISSKDVDARSDVWSLGAILHQLLTGRVPFNADTLGGLMSRVLTEDPPRLSEQRPDLPQAVSDLVTWCLQRDLARRARSVAEIVLALAPFAPARAHPIAERVVATLVAPRRDGSSAPAQLASVPPAGPLPTPQVPATTHSQQGERKPRVSIGATVVISALLLGAAAFGAHHVLAPRPAVPATPSQQARSAPTDVATPASPSGPDPAGSDVTADSGAAIAAPPPTASARAGAGRITATRPATPLAASRPQVSTTPPTPPPRPAGPKKGVLDERN